MGMLVITVDTLLESFDVISALLEDVDMVEPEVDTGRPPVPRTWGGMSFEFSEG